MTTAEYIRKSPQKNFPIILFDLLYDNKLYVIAILSGYLQVISCCLQDGIDCPISSGEFDLFIIIVIIY